MDLEEFKAKVEWEGGVLGALEYGLTVHDLDPEVREANPEFVKAWEEASKGASNIHKAEKALDSL